MRKHRLLAAVHIRMTEAVRAEVERAGFADNDSTERWDEGPGDPIGDG